MKFSIGYFAKPRAPGIPPALLATYTAAIADAEMREQSGSLTGLHGQRSRAIRLWPFDAKPNTTFARLETAYMSGLNAVDQIEEHTRSTTASGRFTPQGVKDAFAFLIVVRAR